jgi:tungstate transport system substrate-binding protein
MRRSCVTGKDAGVDLDAKKGPLVSRYGVRHGTDAQYRISDERLRIGRPRHLAVIQEPRRPHVLVEGDRRLFNQYGVMLVNPAKHPQVKKELGQQFVDWVVSPQGQTAIAGYKIGGEQLFFPNAQG